MTWGRRVIGATVLCVVRAWVPQQRLRLAWRLRATEVEGLWSALDAAQTRADAVRALSKLQEAGAVQYWASARLQPRYSVSIEQLRTTTRAENIADAFGVTGGRSVEKIAALMAGIVTSASVSAVAAQQWLTFLPDIWRFVITQAFCFAPYGAIALGIAIPEEFQRGLTVAYARFLPAYRARLARHEAAHVVAGYVLGLPLARISVNPAAAAVAFYDTPDVQPGALDAEVQGRPPRFVASSAPVEALAICALAGLMSEVDEYGDAEGGVADLSLLQAVYDTTNMSADDQFLTTRWAALQAHLILKRHAVLLETLVAAFLAPGDSSQSVAMAIRTIEEAALDADVTALRQSNRVQPGPLERLLVNPPRPLDFDQPIDYDRPLGRPAWLPVWSPEDVPLLAFLTTMLFVFYAVNGGTTLP